MATKRTPGIYELITALVIFLGECSYLVIEHQTLRGSVFDPYLRRVVSLTKIHQFPTALVNTQEAVALSDFTEKLLTTTFNLNSD